MTLAVPTDHVVIQICTVGAIEIQVGARVCEIFGLFIDSGRDPVRRLA